LNRRFVSVFLPLILIFSLVLPSCSASAAADSDSEKHRGIDVSVWQGDIDFEKVKNSGIEAVYIRAGEGSNIVDDRFEENYKAARDAGLEYRFYHYVTARSVDEAIAPADFFAGLIESKPYTMRAAMDFENLSGLSDDEAVKIARAYLERLKERLGHTPAVYSDAYDAESVWKSNLTAYPLWVADYGVREPGDIGGWKDWSGFQYDDKGSVSGISGHVDLDYFKGAIFLTDKEKSATKKIRRSVAVDSDSCSCN